jgi:hypothetical protein
MVMNKGPTMKTFLIFLTALAFTLAGALLTSGRTPDFPILVAGVTAATLTAWTLAQYNRKFLPLARGRLLRPSLPVVAPRTADVRPRRAAA